MQSPGWREPRNARAYSKTCFPVPASFARRRLPLCHLRWIAFSTGWRRKTGLRDWEFEAWSRRATDYLREIGRIKPFDKGPDITSIELIRELACENGLKLHWAPVAIESSREELQAQIQNLQSNNLRRLLILAVDPDLSKGKSVPDRDRQNSVDLFPFP